MKKPRTEVVLRKPLWGFPVGYEGKVTLRFSFFLEEFLAIKGFRVRLQDRYRSQSGYFAEAEFHRIFSWRKA